jgi:hypothetical protein
VPMQRPSTMTNAPPSGSSCTRTGLSGRPRRSSSIACCTPDFIYESSSPSFAVNSPVNRPHAMTSRAARQIGAPKKVQKTRLRTRRGQIVGYADLVETGCSKEWLEAL